MKKVSFLSVFFIFCYVVASSQSYIPDGTPFLTKAEKYNSHMYPLNYNKIKGDLTTGNDTENMEWEIEDFLYENKSSERLNHENLSWIH